MPDPGADRVPAAYRGPSFAQVLAETAIRDAGAFAWRAGPPDAVPAVSRGSEEAWLGDGSRVAVWPSAGSWVAAYLPAGSAQATVVALGRRPSFAEAAVLGRLAATVVGSGRTATRASA